MSVECIDFISLADRLVAAENSEIASRIAAGRAYYGAYHCCRDLVNRQASIPVNDSLGEHEKIYRAISALSLSFAGAKDLKKIAYKAMQLRDVRVEADYYIGQAFEHERALQAIESARKVHCDHVDFCARYGL